MALTSNLLVVPRNFWAEGTVTASDANVAFPITNTQNEVRDDAWRSNGTGTVTIQVTWSRAKTVSFFAMNRHRAHGANIRVQLFSDAAWTTQVADTSTVAINKVVASSSDTAYNWGDDPFGIGGYDQFITESPFWYYFTPVSVQSATITLSSHSTTFWNVAYWQVSSFWFGNYFQTSINPDYGNTITWVDNGGAATTTTGVPTRTGGGSKRTMFGFRWRAAKLQLSSVTEQEAATWMQIMAYCQTGRPVFASLFPGDGTIKERDNMFPGFFTSLDPYGRQVNRLTKVLTLEEA